MATAVSSNLYAQEPVDVLSQLKRVECEKGFLQVKNKYSNKQQTIISMALARSDEKLRVVTYNMLFDRHDDRLDQQNRWPARKYRLFEEFTRLDADVIAFQELYGHQVQEVMNRVGKDWGYAVVGQESQPNEDTGEVTGFFYRKKRVELQKFSSDFFLKAFDLTTCKFHDLKPRVFAEATFKDKKTQKVFQIINAHLSFHSPDQRELEVETLVRAAKQLQNQGIPTLLTGDFNTFDNRPDRGDVPFHDGPFLHKAITRAGFDDAREVALLGHVGSMSTSTNDPSNTEKEVLFGGTGTPGNFLDHIFVGKGIEVLAHAIDSVKILGGYPSDHQPVIADILLDDREATELGETSESEERYCKAVKPVPFCEPRPQPRVTLESDEESFDESDPEVKARGYYLGIAPSFDS